MRRQADLDKYNPDLQWERLLDKLAWTAFVVMVMLMSVYIYRCWQIGEMMQKFAMG